MNKKQTTNTAVISALSLVFASSALAQKGVGQEEGMARQRTKPPVMQMSGTITEIKVGPCERTTGRSPVGAHLRVRTASEPEEIIDLHLGPAGALQHVLNRLSVGQSLSFEAFRTDAMPKHAYVAKALSLNGESVELRDDNLRPSWASSGAGSGRRSGGQGEGQGKGQGGAMRRGSGAGACWW